MARAASAFAPDLTVVLAAPPIDPAGLGAPSLGAIRLHLGLRLGRGEGRRPSGSCTTNAPSSAARSTAWTPEASPDRSSSAGAFPAGASPPSAAPAIELDRIGVEVTVEAVTSLLGGDPASGAAGPDGDAPDRAASFPDGRRAGARSRRRRRSASFAAACGSPTPSARLGGG